MDEDARARSPNGADAAAAAPRARRGPVRRFLETRGMIGTHEAPHVETRLRADDGTRLAGTYLPGPGSDAPAVLLLHGFAAHRKKPSYARFADVLSAYANVLSIDLRGHGGSGGASTLGDREAMDALAGVRWLRAYGHPWVALVGVSMGGTAAFNAVRGPAGVDALVSVSAPARLREVPETEPMRRLRDIWETPWKRHGMRVLINVRVVGPAQWNAPPHPEDAATQVAVPVLVVHGVDDPYFPIADAESIAARSAGASALWREPPGFGHAEDGMTRAFADRLGRAIAHARVTGRFPERLEVV